MTEIELHDELSDNMIAFENEIKEILGDAELDNKTYNLLYDLMVKIHGIIDLNNRTFIEYLSKK